MDKKIILVLKIASFSLIGSTSFAANYFSETKIYESTVNAPKGLCVGEFNQDSASMDAFVALSADSAIGQLSYSESSGFSLISAFNTIVGNNPISVAAGDFTGDGKTKIATFVQDEGLVFYTASTISNGILSFQNVLGDSLTGLIVRTTGGPEAVAVGRLNGDTNDDLISVGNVGDSSNARNYAYYSISVPTSFSFEPTSSRTFPNSVIINDYNNDGTGDYIITSVGTNSINVILGSGNWGDVPNFTDLSYFTEVGSQPWGLAVGDINADGYPDILTADRGSDSVSVVLNNADGTRVSTLNQTIENVCDEPIDVELADFNADGKSDVAVLCTGDGFLKVYPGNGDGTFATTVIFEKNVGSNPFDIVTDDFNADGHADLLVSVTGSNKIVTLLGNDEPTLSNPSVDTATGVFQITYTDADNEAPESITVTIDGTVTAMTETDASDTTCTDGKIYQATQALSTGSHTYRFAASDGTYDAVGDPSSIVSADQSLTVSPAAGSGGGCSLSAASGQVSVISWLASILVLGASRILRRKRVL